jgi:hypothetical protein
MTTTEQFERANHAAAAATQAWLVTLGLGALVDEFRSAERDAASQIAAPGMVEIRADARQAMANAVSDADAAFNLQADVADVSRSPSARSESLDLVEAAAARAFAGAEAAQRAMRRTAQLALGIAQAAPNTDVVSQIERAAIATIAPAALAGGSAPPRLSATLAYDGLQLYAIDTGELVIELAGVIARLLIEWGGVADLGVATGEKRGVTIRVDADVVLAEAYGEAVISDAAAFLELGWEEADPTGARSRWPSPVTIIEPASIVSRTLAALGAHQAVDLSVTLADNTPRPERAPTMQDPGYL